MEVASMLTAEHTCTLEVRRATEEWRAHCDCGWRSQWSPTLPLTLAAVSAHHADATTDPLSSADEAHSWAGQSLAAIRARWGTGDPFGVDCGENRIPADRQPAVLEALRHARSDVTYLLTLVDTLARRDQQLTA